MANSDLKRKSNSSWYLWFILSIVATLVLIMWVRGCNSMHSPDSDIVDVTFSKW